MCCNSIGVSQYFHSQVVHKRAAAHRRGQGFSSQVSHLLFKKLQCFAANEGIYRRFIFKNSSTASEGAQPDHQLLLSLIPDLGKLAFLVSLDYTLVVGRLLGNSPHCSSGEPQNAASMDPDTLARLLDDVEEVRVCVQVCVWVGG
jgi:hypothetical protein